MNKSFVIAIFSIFLLLITFHLSAQVGINTDNSPPDNSAILDAKSTTKGLLVPRMTQSEIGEIPLPANGLIVYCTTDDKFYAFVASSSIWKEILYGPGTIATSTVPYVITAAISNITTNSAQSGGNATFDGGSPIIERGICWSTSPNPTTANSHTTNGVGTGAFVSNLEGLTNGTLYYIRAFATNSLGTAYGNEISFTTNQIFYLGQNYGGGIIFYIDTTGQHGLIAATQDQGRVYWGCVNVLLGNTSTAFGTGQANTTEISNNCGAGTAARICKDLVLDGYDNWFLPSLAELTLLFSNNYGIGGWDLAYIYWSSSEVNPGYAKGWNLAQSYAVDSGKNYSGNVRAIRAF